MHYHKVSNHSSVFTERTIYNLCYLPYSTSKLFEEVANLVHWNKQLYMRNNIFLNPRHAKID